MVEHASPSTNLAKLLFGEMKAIPFCVPRINASQCLPLEPTKATKMMSCLSEDGYIKEEDKVEEGGSLVGLDKCNQFRAVHISLSLYIFIYYHTKLNVFLAISIVK